MSDATNYSSSHNSLRELWKRCSEQAAEIERLREENESLRRRLAMLSDPTQQSSAEAKWWDDVEVQPAGGDDE